MEWFFRLFRRKPTLEDVAMGSYVRSISYLAHCLAEAAPHNNRTETTDPNRHQRERNCGKRGLDDEQSGR